MTAKKCVAVHSDLGEPGPVPRGIPWPPQDDVATAVQLLAASEGER